MSAPTTASPTDAALESRRRTADALSELNRAVHKIGMYPPDHPLVPAAVESVQRAFAEAMDDRPSVRLGVARDKLLFEGEALDERNAALQWIARTLHAAGVGMLEISRGVSADELKYLVNWLYRVRRGSGHDSGREMAEAAMPGLSVELVAYDRLAFGEKGDENADLVWEGLAQALLAELPAGESFAPVGGIATLGEGRGKGGGLRPSLATLSLSPEKLARTIGSSLQHGEGDSGLGRRLAEVGRKMGRMDPAMREEIRRRLAEMISHLSPELQRQLFSMAGSNRERAAIVSGMADALPPALVLEVLGEVEAAGDRVPSGVMSLLGKLGDLSRAEAAAEEEKPTPEEEQLRGVLRQVFTRKVDENPNPNAYQELLEKISHEEGPAPEPIVLDASYRDPRSARDVRATVAGVAARLLAEDAAGSDAAPLLEHVAGHLAELVRSGCLVEAAEGLAAVRHVRSRGDCDEAAAGIIARYLETIGGAELVDLLLGSCEAVAEEDWPALQELFGAGGGGAVERTLSLLPSHPAGPGREKRVKLLALAEPSALEEGFEAVKASGDEALRAAMPLLRRIPVASAIAIARSLSTHPDATIRIEAFRTLISLDRRDGAFLKHVEIALWDADRRVGRFVLGLVRKRTDAPTCQLLSRYVAGEFGLNDQGQRREAVEVLAASGTPASRDALIGILLSRRLTLSAPDLALRVEAERALLARADAVSARALRRWQRSVTYWVSLLVIRRSA